MPSIDRNEYRRRLNEVVNLLNGRQAKHTIARYMEGKFGCSKRTTERYIRAARDVLTEESGQTRADHIVDAYSFYASIVADTTAKRETRMRAQDSIVKLFGLDTPIRVAQTDTAGNDISPEQVRSELVAIIAEVRRLAGGTSDSTARDSGL